MIYLYKVYKYIELALKKRKYVRYFTKGVLRYHNKFII